MTGALIDLARDVILVIGVVAIVAILAPTLVEIIQKLRKKE